jgi:amidase
VSAGFCPFSIGTEADGSLCTPASRAALYGMKPTVGSTAMDGIFVISNEFDTTGALAKTVSDLSILIEHIQDSQITLFLSNGDYSSALKKSWAGLRLGFVKTEEWFLPSSLVTPDEGVQNEIVSIYTYSIISDFCFLH